MNEKTEAKLVRKFDRKHRIRNWLRAETNWFLPLEKRYRSTKIKWGRKFGLIPPYVPPVIYPRNDYHGGLSMEEYREGFGHVPEGYDIDKMPQADIIDG
ncbi:gp92 [Mycobacterium phage Barnyard]|uniref:Uncharacterized protein n=1 Tax=Mycobacterium phage Barnyard TaxID=205880 RepID=Q855Y0_9CAUD|nr:gp92 [Mycobacterium phage Barnyard]AAN02146.1 hypothetical protein PBI_BARNYARD_92 [Mycobacterium phage Barnyard]